MKDKERKTLLDQLESEAKKRPLRRRPPRSNFAGRGISEEEVEETIKEATAAFRQALEPA
jgi:hypothetical protein